MAYETAEGTPFLSYGELVNLTKNLRGDSEAAGLAAIFDGKRLTNSEACAALAAARMDAQGSETAHRIIDAGLARLEAAKTVPADSHDLENFEEAMDIEPPMRVMSGPVVLDDPSSYDAPARLVRECFESWLALEGKEVTDQHCLMDFNLWIYDAGDPEEGAEWELLIGPLTKAEVGKLDETRATWLAETVVQAFQTASNHLNGTFLAKNRGSMLETEIVVRFLPPEAAA